MKKALVIIVVLFFAFSFAYALKRVDSSRLHSISIYLDYDEVGDWDAHLVCYGELIDDAKTSAGYGTFQMERNSLSPDVRSSLDNFLKHMSKEFNVKMAAEEKETLKSKK